MAANLRHELHKVLQYIIRQAEEVDSSVSTRRIDLARPASRIVGATVILDHFLQMIAGVYEFSPDETQSLRSASTTISLRETVIRFINTFSLIKNTRRTSGLEVKINVPEDIRIAVLPSVIEYLIAVLADNTWKYSDSRLPATITAQSFAPGLIDLTFKNLGAHLPEDASIFLEGYKADPDSEGFGFGLYWAKILVDHYNRVNDREKNHLDLTYRQSSLQDELHQLAFVKQANPIVGAGVAKISVIHTFTLRNITVEAPS